MVQGNELSGSGVGVRVAADQYASDTISLQKLVQDIYKSDESKPLTISTGRILNLTQTSSKNSLRNQTNPQMLSPITYIILAKLGTQSTYDTTTYCRQTLIGGNWGLLNTTTFVPNPDYYRCF